MKEQSKKFKKLKENNNLVFNEIFGFNKKNSNEVGTLNEKGFLYDDDVIEISSDYILTFKETSSSIRDVENYWGEFTHQDWNSKKLSWLKDAKFIADVISIKDANVYQFREGRWVDGNFLGETFLHSNFEGGYFNGKKFRKSSWKTSPHRFVNGTTDEKGMILGIKDILSLNQRKFKFNIIAIVPSNKIQIQMEDRVVHEITVLKRLDENNSDFSYRVKNGNTNESKHISVKWASLRGNNENDFIDITSFSNNKIPNLFTNIFNLTFNSPITKVAVGEDKNFEKEVEWAKKEEPKKSQKELETNQESYDLANAPFLGVKEIIGQPIKISGQKALGKNTMGRVFFNFTTPQHHSIFNEIAKALNEGYVKSYFTQIRSALENGVIKGAPSQYPYLAKIIGKDDSVNVKNLDLNLSNSLDWANKFLQNFIDTMVLRVTKSGKQYDVPNTKVKNQIKNNLSLYLGINKKEEPKVATKSEKPKVATKRPNFKITEEKSIRNMIRKIISENL